MASQKIALAIDDDEAIVNNVKLILKEELNYLVLGATDPQVAVDPAKNYAFDLLVLHEEFRGQRIPGTQYLISSSSLLKNREGARQCAADERNEARVAGGAVQEMGAGPNGASLSGERI